MNSPTPSCISPEISNVFIRMALVGIFIAAATGAAGQTVNSEPVIVLPEQYRGTPLHGGLGDIAKETGESLGSNLETLKKNLGVLHDLNSQMNEAALNRLGQNYGNVQTLGSDLSTAIASIDTARLADSAEKFTSNVQGTMNAYGSTVSHTASSLSDAIKNSPYSAQNPPDQAGAVQIQSQAKAMANAQAQVSMPVLGISYVNVIKLNNNIGKLNSDVVSVTKTYLNLLKIANEPPSAITQIPDLTTDIATVDSVATNQMNVLATIAPSMDAVNLGYANMKEHKGATKESLEMINDGMSGFSERVSRFNTEVGLSLGHPGNDSSNPFMTK